MGSRRPLRPPPRRAQPDQSPSDASRSGMSVWNGRDSALTAIASGSIRRAPAPDRPPPSTIAAGSMRLIAVSSPSASALMPSSQMAGV
jgi:hypothetical protein